MTDALIAELADHPDAMDSYLVLADQLQSAGNPQGELIALQCQPQRTGERDARIGELVAALEAELGGGGPIALGFDWHRGFVRSLRVEAAAPIEHDWWQRMVAHPCLRLVRSLTLACDGDLDGRNPVRRLIAAPMPTLDALSIRAPFDIDADVDTLGVILPRLRSLELDSAASPIRAWPPRLHKLALWSPRLDADALDALWRASLPELRHLVLGWPRPRGADVHAMLGRLLDGEVHPHLEHLALMGSGHEDDLIRDLPARAIRPRLRSIGLHWANVTDVGERALEATKSLWSEIALVWPRPPGIELGGGEAYRLGWLVRNCLDDRDDEAVSLYRRACELAPGDVYHWWGYGNALGAASRRDDQLAAYGRALAINHDHAGVIADRGDALLAIGRLDEARADFERAIAIQPDRAPAWSGLGQLHRRLGHLDAAIAAFERAVAIDPSRGAYRLVESVLDARGAAAALELATRLRDASPDDVWLAIACGRAQLALGDFASALATATTGPCTRSPRRIASEFIELVALRSLDRSDDALAVCGSLAAGHGPAVARTARLQRALLVRERDLLDLEGADGPPHADCNDCAVLAMAAAAAAGDGERLVARRADFDRAVANPGSWREDDWMIADTLAQLGRLATAADVAMIVACYAAALR